MKRRTFGKLAFSVLPAQLFGAQAPSRKIQIGVIGCGRIARTMDVPGIARNSDLAVVTAVCDCDRIRAEGMKEYAQGLFNNTIKVYGNYRELLADPSIDAVAICTPDFSHAEMAVRAAFAGKDVYVQKPLAMSISEGRAIVDVFKKTGRVFHIGSQQRSEGKATFGSVFRRAVEYVRDGRLGELERIEIGLPADGPEPDDLPLVEPVPATFDWEEWQGRTECAGYSQLRSHPQGENGKPNFFGRPGWMAIQRYDMGMIANWGAHHFDIAQWALDAEDTGPVEITATAQFPKRRLWDAHGEFTAKLRYANGTEIHAAGEDVYPNGVRFVGKNGSWIFCSRGSAKATISDPGSGGKHGRWRALEASDAKLIEGEVKLSKPVVRNPLDHHRVWLESILSRRPTNITPEAAHRSTSVCILAHTAMNLGRTLRWDPSVERFTGDDAANDTLVLAERAPHGVLRFLNNL